MIRILPDGRPQIIKDVAFVDLLGAALPNDTKQFTEIIQEFDQAIQLANPAISGNALKNAHGDWYEWLISIRAWNYFVSNADAKLAMLLPNISSFDLAGLYNDNLRELIEDLRAKVSASSGVQLITSNPDFVIIDRALVNTLIPAIEQVPITGATVANLHRLNNLYETFIGGCNFTDIKGYISVKHSLRPDRRLQIPHEGSLMKAIYTHLQTRQWIISPQGLKYYAMAGHISDADRDALNTVATHSITTVHSMPQPAVDMVFVVNSFANADTAFLEVLA